MIIANIISIGVLLLGFYICYLFRAKIFNDFNVFIRKIALLVFISGVILYFIGFRNGSESMGTQLSWFASLFRPILSSLEMFAFHSDLIEVGEGSKENMVYMGLFSLTHFAAAAVSFAVAINYLGVRIKSVLRWNRLKRAKELNGNVEVFFGINLSTLSFATDIKKNQPNDIIIFVDAPDEQTNQGLLGMSSIFNVFGLKREVLVHADKLNAVIKQVRTPLHLMTEENVLEQIGLTSVLDKTKEYLGFYFLYGDHQLNITKTIKLRQDKYFASNNTKKASIFCKATRGQTNGGTAFEFNSNSNIETVLIDSALFSAYSVLSLPQKDNETKKHRYLGHPVNFIDIDQERGVALSKFECMCIGFGETGHNMLRFLYEFGQFQYPDDYQGKHFVCHVVDPDVNNKQGHFLMKSPGLWKDESPDKSTEIQWHKFAADSGNFWGLMRDVIDELNYVVIAIGNDDRNLLLAYDIYDFALRWRKPRLKKFAVFVRSYKYSNENRFDDLTQICHDENGNHILHTFGKVTEIITHQFIWKNYLEQNAATFNLSYNNNSSTFKDIYISNEKKAMDEWQQRHAASRCDARMYANTKRLEIQQFSKDYHIYTKMHLIGIDDPNNPIGIKNRELIEQCDSITEFEKLPFFLNLAKLEHRRWLASNECIGYSQMTPEEYDELNESTICDSVRHKHMCMVPWEELKNMPCTKDIVDSIPEEFRHRPYEYIHEQNVRVSLAIGINEDNEQE